MRRRARPSGRAIKRATSCCGSTGPRDALPTGSQCLASRPAVAIATPYTTAGPAPGRGDSRPLDEGPGGHPGRHFAGSDQGQLRRATLGAPKVRNEHGQLVEGGVGDSAEDALLEVYERLIPPS